MSGDFGLQKPGKYTAKPADEISFPHGCMAQLFIFVAKQVGGEPTGSRNSLFFCPVDVMVHIRVKSNFYYKDLG